MSERPELMLAAARRAAWLYTPPALEQWREDIAADAVLGALVNRRAHAGLGTAHSVYRWAVLHAVRRLMFLLRGQAEFEPEWEEPSAEPHELGPLPLWRLQRVWEDLTDLQQLVLREFLAGGSLLELSRRIGVDTSAVHRARNTALARLDEHPTTPRRSVRSYQRIDLRQARKPADPVKVSEQLRRDAQSARVKRAAKRSAAVAQTAI